MTAVWVVITFELGSRWLTPTFCPKGYDVFLVGTTAYPRLEGAFRLHWTSQFKAQLRLSLDGRGQFSPLPSLEAKVAQLDAYVG